MAVYGVQIERQIAATTARNQGAEGSVLPLFLY